MLFNSVFLDKTGKEAIKVSNIQALIAQFKPKCKCEGGDHDASCGMVAATGKLQLNL